MADLIAQFAGRDDLPERDPDDFYATPYDAASTMCEMLYRYLYTTRPDTELRLIDIGADEGVWGEAFYDVVEDLDFRQIKSFTALRLAGIEKRVTSQYHQIGDGSQYNDWVIGDATDMSIHPAGYRIAFGNPPFLKSSKPGELMTKFLLDMKRKYQVCAFLLQTNYLASEQRYNALFQEGLAVVAQSISRIHFEGRGKQQYREYAFYIWDQNYPARSMPRLTWFDSNKQTIDSRFLEVYNGA